MKRPWLAIEMLPLQSQIMCWLVLLLFFLIILCTQFYFQDLDWPILLHTSYDLVPFQTCEQKTAFL